MKRARGTGGVEPARGGGFRARLPGHGARLPLVFATREEAEGALAAAIGILVADVAAGRLTLDDWAGQVLDRRELQGQRAARSYRSVWRAHVSRSPIAALALTDVRRADVVAWVDELSVRRVQPGRCHGAHVAEKRARRTIARQTAQNALNVLRLVLADAVERGRLEANPADGVTLPRAVRKRARTHEPWTYLTLEEQRVLLTCEAIPERERLAIAFALGTGARQDEQWATRVQDVDLARRTVTLRRTKNGVPRTVGLLPVAHDAVTRWLLMRRAEGHTSDLLWPTVRGCRRRGDPRDWQAWIIAAGLAPERRHDERHVRWHDLRHTCGTSLVRGWWGPAWSLEQVRVQLGHASVTTTERYAHVGIDMLAAMLDRPTVGPHLPAGAGDEPASDPAAPPRRLERPANGLGNAWEIQRLRSDWPQERRGVGRLAVEVLAMAALGDRRAVARAIALAEAVLEDERREAGQREATG